MRHYIYLLRFYPLAIRPAAAFLTETHTSKRAAVARAREVQAEREAAGRPCNVLMFRYPAAAFRSSAGPRDVATFVTLGEQCHVKSGNPMRAD